MKTESPFSLQRIHMRSEQGDLSESQEQHHKERSEVANPITNCWKLGTTILEISISEWNPVE